ncbi:MAG: peptide chain release factor N(5)-glutamine methyltransferase [Erysipelotrichaceae bacterium]|nr:peptide chain release factor N(5)-glutamine methyltransferase [Erysipelotrichaceae bacterium]
MATYNQLIHKYTKAFNDKGLSANTLKAFIFELCNENDVNLYLEMDNECLPIIEKKYEDGVKRLLNDEPMNYVLGYSYFYGYKMLVNKDVLIPRFETEELVGLILSKYDEFYPKKDINICDVGTGSGAIAIALKKEESRMNVFASDISEEAVSMARQNAKINDADVTFMVGSMLEPYIENNIKVDILVSNPPYIKVDEVLENSVKDYEPHLALFGGNDGLKFYRIIFENALKVVKDDGLMFFEMGYDQKENLTSLAKEYFPKAMVEVYKDINKKDRMLMINLKGE